MSHRTATWLVLAAALLALAPTPYRSGTFTVDIPSAKWKTVRLRDVPKGVLVSVDVKSDGRLTVFLVDANDLRRFPRFARPLFQGDTERRMSFSVKIPEAGTHYVVLFNRSTVALQTVTVTVSATRTNETVPSPRN